MKSHLLKSCSMLLVLALLVQLLPMQILGTELDSLLTADLTEEVLPSSPQATSPEASPEVIGEIVSKRTRYTKEYLLNNGLHMAVVYPEAVHYDKDGQWEQIDNTLKAVGIGSNAVYTTTAGEWSVSFPQQLSGNKRISVTRDGYTLSFGLAGQLRSGSNSDISVMSLGGINPEESQLQVDAASISAAAIQQPDLDLIKSDLQYPDTFVDTLFSRLQYDNVYGSTDIAFDINSREVKESIILASYDPQLYGYRYTLQTGGMLPVLEEDNSISIYSPDGTEVIMTMPAPYMIDSAGEESYDVSVTLTPNGSAYTLTYRPSKSWLASSDRSWPVILDPSVVPGTGSSNIEDVFIAETRVASYNNGALQCGKYGSNGKMRTYIRFTNIPVLEEGDVVVDATLRMSYLGGSAGNTTINAHQVYADDEGNTWVGASLLWNNQPTYNTVVEDYCNVNENRNYTYFISNIAKAWYETGVNTGLMLKATDSVENGSGDNWKKFYAVNYSIYATHLWPMLTLYYRNTSGLESYWDYTSHSAGRAGTGHINNFTGGLVWTRGDLGFGGTRMPVSISHIYNSTQASDNTFGLGLGWRTNYHQQVKKSGNFYAWTDADGTDHYFSLVSGSTYKDEDGLELTLEVGADKIISDKYGNKSYFDSSGRLYKMENNQQTRSSITVTYTDATGSKIATVTDGVGRKYNFAYNANGLLNKISYVGKGTEEISCVTYKYADESDHLAKIIDDDGLCSTYGYSNGRLVSVTDVDGYCLQYTYADHRVAGVTESFLKENDTANGGTLFFEYGSNQTKITDHNGNVQLLQFNDWGNTISIQDGEGRAQYAQYALDINSSNAKTNQLRLSSKLQNTVSNRIANSSFETGSVWSSNISSITTTRSTDKAYYGSYSMKVTSTATGTVNGAYATPIFVDPGQSLTLSAYLNVANTRAQLGFHCIYGDHNFVVRGDEISDSNNQWIRAEVTYTNHTSESLPLAPYIYNLTPGTTYLDCVQLEYTATASRYNLIENGDFVHDASGWTRGVYFTTTEQVIPRPTQDSDGRPITIYATQLDENCFSITSESTLAKHLYQTVKVSGNKDDVFVLGGWGKAASAPLYDGGPQFALVAIFNNTDGSTTTQMVRFNADCDDWQYTAGAIKAEQAYNSINIDLQYDYNVNFALFDGIQLFKEEFGTSYEYDENGNLTSVTDLQKQNTTYEYQNNNLTKIIQNGSTKMTYGYDTYGNVTSAVTEAGVKYEFVYDTYGNNTLVKIVSGNVSIQSQADYTDDGNRLEWTRDALDKQTTYCYNENTNVLEWVQYPNDTTDSRTHYDYDDMFRVVTAAAEVNTGDSLWAGYIYENDLLTRIETQSTTYKFTYGDFSLREKISIGNRELATYTYTGEPNWYLSALEYGNGGTVSYEYDQQGRVTRETFGDGTTVTYDYDNTGALATVTDSATGIKTTYYYDLIDRMVKYVESGTGLEHSVQYGYDTLNNLTLLTEIINGITHTTSYTYDADNRVTQVTNSQSNQANSNRSKHYTYDAYGRTSQIVTKNGSNTVLTSQMTFQTLADGRPTTQISSLRNTAASYDTTINYTYDDNGNITSVAYGQYLLSYEYDSANQLIRENDRYNDITIAYEYDDAGNLLSKSYYPYTVGELGEPEVVADYSYGDSSWGDLLTGYYGRSITYDAIGNPLSDGIWTYTWQNGRELSSMTSGNTTWTYTYDANGMRTSRTNGTDTYTYVYNGSQLVQMQKNDTDTLYFDHATGTVTWNGVTYYYVYNLQGDVIAILDGNGTCVAEYIYDAWGYLVYTYGSLGFLNPLTYRGYVYDHETGLYYLQSRYYNPEIGRFLNADAYASTGQGILGNNMFAYCLNNPVCLNDTSGARPRKEFACEIFLADGGGVSPNVRDVTSEVNAALGKAVSDAKNFRAVVDVVAGDNILGALAIYSQFYLLVNHEADWDIKREEPWERTIGTAFPGKDVGVIFGERTMTPENLGNFTYGVLGYAYGIPLEHLVPGSWYAAGFPLGGDRLSNEVLDWFYIVLGYECAVQAYPERG